MAVPRVRDLCGLYCVTEFANYLQAEFFMYLIGTGVSRSRYELTAHDRKTHALLFVVQVDASAQALAVRARKAGTNTDAQAVAAAFDQARRIVETKAYEQGRRFRLQLEADAEILRHLA
jgi:hypothetical protein